MEQNKRLNELFHLYYKGKATEAESTELMEMLDRAKDETLANLLQQTWKSDVDKGPFFGAEVRQKMLSELKEPETDPVIKGRPGAVRSMKIWKYAAAAAVLVLVSLTVYLLVQKDAQVPLAENDGRNKVIVNDVAPGGDKAVLTLADGRRIVLDSAGSGALADQGGIKVINLDGQLAYRGDSKATEVLYNTITTPRGGQYQLVLADGSKVWLNAASSLRFPTAFPGKERTVELTGEGYFEVAHNGAQPFHVKILRYAQDDNAPDDNPVDVEVLGTHFNINSYSNEPAIKTTLLEGRVKVRNDRGNVILNPGQQAVIVASQPDIRVKFDVDVDEVVAWKNGRFLFNSAGIETIMRQAERWYDVNVIYEGKTEETFSGLVPRSENISQLLKILEATDRIDFTIRDKEVIVKPK